MSASSDKYFYGVFFAWRRIIVRRLSVMPGWDEATKVLEIIRRVEEKRRSGLLVGQCLRDQANGFRKPSGKPMSAETRRKKMRVIERALEVCNGL